MFSFPRTRAARGMFTVFSVVTLLSGSGVPARAHEEAETLHGHARPTEQKPTAFQSIKSYLLSRPTEGAPNRLERITVGAGSAAVSVVGLGAGLGFGVLAVLRPACADNISRCDLAAPEVNLSPAYQLGGRLGGEPRLLLADVSFGASAAFAIIAAAALLTAFWPDGVWPLSTP